MICKTACQCLINISVGSNILQSFLPSRLGNPAQTHKLTGDESTSDLALLSQYVDLTRLHVFSHDCSWNRSGHKLLTASTDFVVSVWDVLTGECDRTFRFPSPVLKVQFHPRDRLVCFFKVDIRHSGWVFGLLCLCVETDMTSGSYTLLTRMWANAQPDGLPAEHRWRALFNAAKFGWCPLLDAVQ